MRTPTLVLAFLLFTAHAAAGNGTGVVVTGESTLQPQLAAQLETWLTEHGHPLVSSPLPPEAISTLIDCFVIEDEGCARAIVEKRAKADTVVFARIDVSPGTNGMRDVMLVAYWFEKGHEAITDRRFCERCTDHHLRGAANELIASLARAGAHGLGRLNLITTPSNARVLIDGQSVGVTPLNHELKPGNHTIAVELDGHVLETRDVVIRDGESTQVDLPLAPLRKRNIPIVPAALVAGGAVALITGGVLIAVDENPSPGGPLYINNTMPGGIALVAVGAVAAGLGVYLWLRERDSGPTVSASKDAYSVGWFARF